MKHYTFCKKDGTIKKNYIPICEYIIQTKMENHQLTKYKSDVVVKDYYCYTTPYKWFTRTKEKENYINKIREICSNFNVTIQRVWIYPEISIEFQEHNVKKMINEIKKLLGGDTYT